MPTRRDIVLYELQAAGSLPSLWITATMASLQEGARQAGAKRYSHNNRGDITSLNLLRVTGRDFIIFYICNGRSNFLITRKFLNRSGLKKDLESDACTWGGRENVWFNDREVNSERTLVTHESVRKRKGNWWLRKPKKRLTFFFKRKNIFKNDFSGKPFSVMTDYCRNSQTRGHMGSLESQFGSQLFFLFFLKKIFNSNYWVYMPLLWNVAGCHLQANLV